MFDIVEIDLSGVGGETLVGRCGRGKCEYDGVVANFVPARLEDSRGQDDFRTTVIVQ